MAEDMTEDTISVWLNHQTLFQRKALMAFTGETMQYIYIFEGCFFTQ